MTTYTTSKQLVDVHRAYGLIAHLQNYYPDFATWYWNKAVPDILLGAGALVLASQRDTLVGVALARGGARPKLRCVRVVPECVGRGVGVGLVDHVLRAINCDAPPVTVPEERVHDFARMFVNRFGFHLSTVERGLYRPRRLEYVFNTCEDQRIKTPYGG